MSLNHTVKPAFEPDRQLNYIPHATNPAQSVPSHIGLEGTKVSVWKHTPRSDLWHGQKSPSKVGPLDSHHEQRDKHDRVSKVLAAQKAFNLARLEVLASSDTTRPNAMNPFNQVTAAAIQKQELEHKQRHKQKLLEDVPFSIARQTRKNGSTVDGTGLGHGTLGLAEFNGSRIAPTASVMASCIGGGKLGHTTTSTSVQSRKVALHGYSEPDGAIGPGMNRSGSTNPSGSWTERREWPGGNEAKKRPNAAFRCTPKKGKAHKLTRRLPYVKLGGGQSGVGVTSMPPAGGQESSQTPVLPSLGKHEVF